MPCFTRRFKQFAEELVRVTAAVWECSRHPVPFGDHPDPATDGPLNALPFGLRRDAAHGPYGGVAFTLPGPHNARPGLAPVPLRRPSARERR